jgi:hypothetical protein
MRRRLDALKLGKWEHDEEAYTVFWLREAIVERAASFYAPLLRVMASYQHCPEEEQAETDEATFSHAPDAKQPWWSWLRADGIRAECSHVVYWSDADLARLPAAGMRRRVLNLRRTIAERFESMRARRVLQRAGLADVTLRDFSWAHLLGSSRTWSFQRLRRVPQPLRKLRELRRAAAIAALAARGAAGAVDGGGGGAVMDRAEEERLLGPAPWDEHDEREGRVATAEGEYVFVPGLDLFNHRQRSSNYEGAATGSPVAHVQIRVSDDGLFAEALVVGAARKGEQVCPPVPSVHAHVSFDSKSVIIFCFSISVQVFITYGELSNMEKLLGFNFAFAPVAFPLLAAFESPLPGATSPRQRLLDLCEIAVQHADRRDVVLTAKKPSNSAVSSIPFVFDPTNSAAKLVIGFRAPAFMSGSPRITAPFREMFAAHGFDLDQLHFELTLSYVRCCLDFSMHTRTRLTV